MQHRAGLNFAVRDGRWSQITSLAKGVPQASSTLDTTREAFDRFVFCRLFVRFYAASLSQKSPVKLFFGHRDQVLLSA